MHNRHRKTLAAIFTDPTPATLPWRDIEALFRALRAEIREGEGSRVRVSLAGVRQVFHRPHPRPLTSRLTVRDVRDFLKRAGVQP